MEFDHKDLLFSRIDRRRKMYVTILLKALGYTGPSSLLEHFYQAESDTPIEGRKFFKLGGAGADRSDSAAPAR